MKIYSKRHAKHGKLVIPEITRYIPTTVKASNVKTLPFIDVGEFPGAMERVQAYLKVTAEPRQLSVSWVLDGIVSNMNEGK